MTTRTRARARRAPIKRPTYDELPLLLTAEQAWELLGVRKTRFYELKSAGLVRAVEMGPQSVRYAKADIAALVERLRRGVGQ